VLIQLVGPSGCTSLSIVAHSVYSADWFPQNKAGGTTAAVGKRVLRHRRRRDPHIDRVASGANCVQSSRDAEGVENSALIAWIWPVYATAALAGYSQWRAETHAWHVHRCADVTN